MASGMASLPAHKLIPGTGFIVDGFKFKSPLIKQYFLSHAHSDHYTGLRENWDYGLVHCSEMTGRLVVQIVGVNPDIVRGHKMDTPIEIDGVEVIFVDANHCPGAAQIIFRLSSGESYIHCGDMRFGPHLLENPYLNQIKGCNAVFLDTTYCNAKYTFPPQEEAVEYIASLIEKTDRIQDGKRRLFLIQTYVIGKERILIEVFKRTGKKLFVSEKKLAIMECIDMPGLDIPNIFTTNPDATNIHLTQWGWLGESWPFFRPNFKNMDTARKTMGVDEVIGFCPTGWMYEMKKKAYPVKKKGTCSIHLVPYSEHSSYSELRTYVQFLKPHKVIPTVGVEGENGEKNLRSMLKHFRNLVDENASKANFLAAFKGKPELNRQESGISSNCSELVKSELEERESTAELDSDLEENISKQDGAIKMEERIADGNTISDEDVKLEGATVLKTAPSEKEEIIINNQPKIEPKDNKDTKNAALQSTEDSKILVEDSDLVSTNCKDKNIKNPRTESTEGNEVRNINQEDMKSDFSGPDFQDDSNKNDKTESFHEDALGNLLAVLGNEISTESASDLLTRSKGDVESAVNKFYDAQRMSQAPKPKAVTQPNKKRKIAPKSKMTPNKTTPGSNKKKGAGPDQRSIMSFFKQPKSIEPKNGKSENKPETIIMLEDDTDGSKPQKIEVKSEVKEEKVETEIKKEPEDKNLDEEFTEKLGEKSREEAEGLSVKRKLTLPPVSLISTRSKAPRNKNLSPQTAPKQEIPRIEEPNKQQVEKIKGRQKKPAPIEDRSSQVPWDAVLKGVKEYDPVKMAIWEEGSVAPYLHVGRALQAMDSTTKRLRISDVIANMFRSLLVLSPDDILPAAYLITGKVAPDYEGIEMNVGGSIVSQAVMEATGVTRQRLGTMYRELGDLGDVAQACRHNQSTLHKPAPLSIRGVFKTMKQIASEKGNGSALKKQRAVMGLLRSAREEEPKYIVRTLISNLRVGANWRSVIPGLARAFVYHEKGLYVSKAELDTASAAVSDAFHQCPNLDLLIQALRDGGLEELHRRCTLKAGVPLKPMLAKICEGIPDALRQLKGDFLAEFKYDGTRCQIHLLPNGSVKLFSRNCEDKTVAYPDVVEIVKQAAAGGARELVMDAELVAVDRENENRLRAFQELSTRARGQTEMHQVSVNVCVFVFDILMVDGDVLLKSTMRDRRARVAQALPNMKPGFIQLAQSIQLTSPDSLEANVKTEEEKDGEPSIEAQVNTYLLESFANGVEGLMLKPLDVNATYQASKRSENWLKLKKDYCEGLRDSLDLVPIGAWWGQGRKTGWFSPFLMAAWDPEKEEYQSVCRCMSGFTDVFYTEATERLKGRMCERKSYYNTGEHCSVWFEPGEVWEIRGADLTISPVHRAAIGCIDANPDRGVSLRFPRHIRVREDKTVEEATSPDVIVDLYNKQTRKMSSAKEKLEAQKKRDNAEDAKEREPEPKSEEEVELKSEEDVA